MVSEPRPGETVADPTWVRVLVWVSFPLLGAGAGWLLRLLAGWLVSLRWAPFKGPSRLIDSIPEPLGTIGLLVVGAAAGLWFAYVAARESLVVTVSGGRVTLARDAAARAFDRSAVHGVFVEGKELVLLGADSGELAREASDLEASRLADAFQGHGFPWLPDGDPYRDRFRRWVEDMPDLPAGANALLKARGRAVEKGDRDDAGELRGELAKLGVVVRDEKKRQYWRSVDSAERPPGIR